MSPVIGAVDIPGSSYFRVCVVVGVQSSRLSETSPSTVIVQLRGLGWMFEDGDMAQMEEESGEKTLSPNGTARVASLCYRAS